MYLLEGKALLEEMIPAFHNGKAARYSDIQ